MQKLENLANMLDRAECPEEAEFVRDLWQQRDELLEALKALQRVGCFEYGMLGNHPSILKAVEMSVEAITKAEAAE